jgi:methyl-accepting chemotaxis protein-1 (serine sensor receptor)
MGQLVADEQSRGIDQVGQAVAEMDRVTQQNASLVEESAAAAAALEEQAARLNEAVAVFKIARGQALKTPATKTYTPKAKPVAAVSEANWETF